MLELENLAQIDCELEQGGVQSVEINLPLQYRRIMSDDRESNPRNEPITIIIKDQVRCTQATKWRLQSELVAIGAALQHCRRSLRILACG
jgi:hypothetical protein